MRVPTVLLLTAFAAIGLVGCDNDPDQWIFGAWTVDQAHIQLPPLPWPGVSQRLQLAVSSTTLKLRSDHSFALALNDGLEGKWRLDGNTVLLTSKDGGPVFTLEVAPNHKIMHFQRQTGFGPVELQLHHSG